MQRDPYIGEFAKMEPVQQELGPGNGSLMADACVESHAGTYDESASLAMI